MHNSAIVIGRVTGVTTDRDAIVVLVEDKSNPKYPVTAACRFFGDKPKAQAQEVANGELVRVEGAVKSREHQGKWYTEFSAWRLTRLGGADAGQSRPSSREKAPPPDDSDLPF